MTKSRPLKKSITKKPHTPGKPVPKRAFYLRPVDAVRRKTHAFLLRRPHRSFRRTYRRDYTRSLKMPGYIAFTKYVGETLLSSRGLFVKVVLFYALAIAVFGGITNQETYGQISDLLKQSSGEIFQGSWGKVGEAGLLLISAFGGGAVQMSIDQQIYLGIALLFVWLASVWLLREVLAGRKPRLRDGLYNSGAPFLSTLLIFIVAIIQLIPVGLVAAAFAGLSSVGLIAEGFGSMLFYIFAGIVLILVLYWLTSTFIAAVIVTLPGMYPGRALSIAGDLVVGRRLRILYRILWMLLVALIAWAVIAIPFVLLDSWIKSVWEPFRNVPLMPVIVALLSAVTTVWCAGYIYLLYRRIVDDDAKPA